MLVVEQELRMFESSRCGMTGSYRRATRVFGRLLQINILRAAVNKLVCDGPNGLKFLGPERIAQLQDNSRQKLLG